MSNDQDSLALDKSKPKDPKPEDNKQSDFGADVGEIEQVNNDFSNQNANQKSFLNLIILSEKIARTQWISWCMAKC